MRLILLLCVPVLVIAGWIDPKENIPSFDPKEVVCQVSGFDNDEFMIDTTLTYVPIPGRQCEPAVAFDGTNYLVVWEDHREGVDIYGTLVTQDGIVLDRTGIEISTATGAQSSPSIAFDGTNYLVVWNDTRNGSFDDIYGARVSQTGSILDRNGIAISRAMGVQYGSAVAFDGSNYFVVWTDSRHGGDQTDIYGARVTTTGVVLDTAGIAVRVFSYIQYTPALAFDGTNYLVTWEHLLAPGFSDIHGSRVTPAGSVLDNIVICSIDSAQSSPALAFDGTNYLVAWEDQRYGPTDDIYGTRVSSTGTVLDPDGIMIASGGLWNKEPSVAFDGTNFLVAWEDLQSVTSNDIYAARINQDGVLLDPTGFVVSDVEEGQTNPALAFDGTSYLAVWEDRRSDPPGDIYGARIGPTGAVLDSTGIAITATVNVQYNPALAFDGTNYLVTWSDDRNGTLDIYGARVNQTGSLLDIPALAISTADGEQNYPAVGFDGTNYLVTWEDERSGGFCDIYGSRVTPEGQVLNPTGFVVSSAPNLQRDPVMAFDGTNYLVVWQDFRDATNYKIYGARVTPGGAVLDTAGIPISFQNLYQYAPGIAFDGTNYLVAWMDHRGYPNYDIYGARVTPAGAVLDSTGFVVSAADNNQRYPAISYNGTNCLIVWDDTRSNTDIYGARVTPAGVILEPTGFPVCAAPGTQYTPKLAFDGTDWLVVWKDGRSYPASHIYGARVEATGTVIDSFVVSTHSDDQHVPDITCGTGGNALAAYISWTDTLFSKIYDAFRVWVRPAPFSIIGIAEDRTVPGFSLSLPLKLEIYPNPAKSVLRVRIPFIKETQTLKIFDVTGKLIKELKVTKPEVNLSLKNVNPGVYFLKLGAEKISQKLIVTE